MRLVLIALAAIGLISCREIDTKSTSPPPAAGASDDHDHGHEHAAHGPHGGHPFSLTGLDATLEAVTNKTNDLVQVFFLDHDAKSPQPLKLEKVVVKTDKLGGKSFELQPVSPDVNGLTAECSLQSKDLMAITPLSPTIEVTIDGKTYSGAMEFHFD